MHFWRHVEPGLPAASYQLRPLTGEMVAACEQKFGVRFPGSFIELLRTQNGGLLENSDFKFDGKDYGCSRIFGLDDRDEYNAVWWCTTMLERCNDKEFSDLFRTRAGDPARILIFGANDYAQYAFDYVNVNSDGEPPVLWLMLGEGDVRCGRVADSFSGFLQRQYHGDTTPAVCLEDAANYQLLAEGSYTGHHVVNGTRVAMSWKICTHEDRIILFSMEDWGHNEPPRFTRAELKKTELLFQRRLAKWEIQEAGGSEFVALLRRTVERFGVLVKPDGYLLRLEVRPGGKEWIKIQETSAYRDRWKNSSSEITNTSIYSSDRAALEAAMRAVVESI